MVNVNEMKCDLNLYSLPTNDEIGKLMDLFVKLRGSMDQKFAKVFVKQDRLEQLIKTQYAGDKINEQTARIFPLDTVQDVTQFEENLKNPDYRCEVIAHLKRITGRGQPWKNAAYKLSATLFTKNVLTMYSWTGVSRTNVHKEPFSKLVNILDAFYQVIYLADNTFSHIKKEEFFRGCILKHSNSRLNPKKKVAIAKNILEGGGDANIKENISGKDDDVNN